MVHNYVLAKCEENSKTHYIIVEACKVVKALNQIENCFIYFHNNCIPCVVITSSTSKDELEVEMANIVGENFSKSNSRRIPNDSTISCTILEKSLNIMDCEEDRMDDAMIIIGPNGTAISALHMSRINWSDYKTATRGLLYAVFTPEALATHILPMSSYMKPHLDARKVDDIVFIVSDTFNVIEEIVLAIISYYCDVEDAKYEDHLKNSFKA